MMPRQDAGHPQGVAGIFFFYSDMLVAYVGCGQKLAGLFRKPQLGAD
jgi:hypothetical protein